MVNLGERMEPSAVGAALHCSPPRAAQPITPCNRPFPAQVGRERTRCIAIQVQG
jgi:hypothetical protein